MSAYKPIRYLLANDSAVAALVGTRIYPVTVPDNPVYPCIVIAIVSEQSKTMVSLVDPWQIVTARVQVTVLANDYPTKEALMNAVIAACKSGSATIDGVIVNLIMSATLGPDFRDDTVKLFMQSQDFKVMYNQPS